jgi:glycosyltransferase involved in cell wall biosynthesis
MNRITAKDIQLDVYGNIVDRNYYDQCVKEYSFNFKGTTNYLAMLQILKEYDFLILPSVFPEMYSLIIKDSFYEQLPVIASSSKGNREAIVDGADGFIFNYDNAKHLATTIDKAYSLKNRGWVSTFTNPENSEKEIEEILFYYK